MRNKIITLAMTAALTVPMPASADSKNVHIYGEARLSLDRVDSGGSGGKSTVQVSSNASYFGIKGSKEIGVDLSVIWQIEQIVNIDNSTTSTDGYGSNLATRNTFISLWDSKKGIFALGRYNTPYKIASRYMDVFGDTVADNRSLMGGARLQLDSAGDATNITPTTSGTSAGASFDGNQGDVAAYVTPAIAGFTGAVAYVAGAEDASVSGTAKGDAWSGALLYTNGTLNLNLGYEIHNFGSAGSGTLGPTVGGLAAPLDDLKEEAWKVAASYVLDPVIVYAVYEKTEDDLGAILGQPEGSDLLGHRSVYVGAKLQLGKNVLKAAYTDVGDLAYLDDTGATQWSIGYDRKLDRSTTIYVLYTKLDNDDNATYSLTSPEGSTGGVIASAAGEDPSAISIGINHKF